MRTPAVFLLIVFASVASAQRFSGQAPVFGGSFGNVVFPGATASTPGVQRFFPNVVFPSGIAPRVYLPNSAQDPTRLSGQFAGNRGFVGSGSGFGSFGGGFRGNGRNGSRNGNVVAVPYAIPIYVGGYAGYGGYYDSAPPPDAGAAYGPGGAPQPNTIVVYPPVAPPPLGPPNGGYGETYAPPLPPAATPDQGAATAPPTYLIAFKDHTIYSAVAYWVEGDTLHYFTSGATHNQVSLSLIDRNLTLRLNQEAGNNMQLPNN